MLLLNKKHTDTLIEQTKSKPQKKLEFKLNKQTENFSFSPSKNISEYGKWLLAVATSETTDSVFVRTDENNSYSINTPGCWRNPNYLENGIIDKPNDLLKRRSENDKELHVGEVKKRGYKIKTKSKEFSLSDFDTSKKEIVEESKSSRYHDLEDSV